MADMNTEAVSKKNSKESFTEKFSKWFKGLKAEYNKIVWEGKEQVTRETVAVVIITAIVGVLIAIVDYILKYGIDILTKWSL